MTTTISATMLACILVATSLAACATTSDPQRPGATDGAPALTADADRTIEVTATAPFSFAPDDLTVEVGETITFEVTNDDAVDHDFVLGDEAAQQDHADEMGEMQDDEDMHHDEANAVTVPAGVTSTITWTFSDAGTILYGCHEPGHYEAGMVGAITVRA